jgi:hypothetical protein
MEELEGVVMLSAEHVRRVLRIPSTSSTVGSSSSGSGSSSDVVIVKGYTHNIVVTAGSKGMLRVLHVSMLVRAGMN